MKFQPGDKVSFINEKQEGIVKKILANNMVVVEIEDGFEFPVRENELVKTGTTQINVPVAIEKPEAPVIPEINSLLEICPDKSAIIASSPEVAGTVLTGPVTYYLVNRTGHKLLFTFYSRQAKDWKGIANGISENESTFELGRFKRDELTDIQSFLFQGLLFSETGLLQISVIRYEFGVLVPSLNNARKDVQGMASFAATVQVYTETSNEDLPIEELVEKFNPKENISKTVSARSVNSAGKQSNKYGILTIEKEVDLHIEELVKDVSGLNNSEMLAIQMKQFSREMDQALLSHCKKIIFIHGVGNGKLKNEIRNELRNYNGIAFKDADNRKFGNGATEVIFM